jgi:thioredoxin-related protein
MCCRICLALVVAGALLVFPAAGGDPPAKDAKGKTADKGPYNEKADAKADLQAALQRAKKDNRHVLIQWGGNWCSWCVLLHKKFTTDAELRRKLLYEYDVVAIDVGQLDKNLDLAKQYKAALSEGVPYLTILDGDGKVLANQRTDVFETKDAGGQNGHDAKKLLEFLTKHQAKPQIADKVLQAGLEQAAKTDRLVFLHFGAPWCGWCHRLEDWMALPDVTATLGKEFVDVKIDIDRMDGGKEVLQRYNKTGKGGIPWFAFVDRQGKVLATSDGPKGNIGFPYEEHEIVYFVKMLETTRQHLSPQDIERLEKSLRAQKTPGKS